MINERAKNPSNGCLKKKNCVRALDNYAVLVAMVEGGVAPKD